MNYASEKIERLERLLKLREMENKELIRRNIKLDADNYYLKKRDNTLEALEKSLPQRIKTYKSKNAPELVIKELQFIADMLMMEKEKLLKKEWEYET